MKIAFDVKGTLDGSEKVLKLFKWCEKEGHELTVWSSIYDFACSCVKKHELGDKVEKMTKRYNNDFCGDPSERLFDIAVDDDGFCSQGLSAKRIILVSDIPDDEGKFRELIELKVEFSKDDLKSM